MPGGGFRSTRHAAGAQGPARAPAKAHLRATVCTQANAGSSAGIAARVGLAHQLGRSGYPAGARATWRSQSVDNDTPCWAGSGDHAQHPGLLRRLSAYSEICLVERAAMGDRLEVVIRTGRPHQIRIHLAQIGSRS